MVETPNEGRDPILSRKVDLSKSVKGVEGEPGEEEKKGMGDPALHIPMAHLEFRVFHTFRDMEGKR